MVDMPEEWKGGIDTAQFGRYVAQQEQGAFTQYGYLEMCIRDSLKEEQTAAYSAEIWKRFRKWGGVPTGATQNVKDLLSSPEIENILENSDLSLIHI